MPGPNATLLLSPVGLAMLKGFESLRLQAYQDVRGILTIGYGHTGPEVTAGLVWTQEQALQALQEDVSWAVNAVGKSVTVPLLQYQFDALVSFTFNVGPSAFKGSTLLVLLNEANFVGAGQQFGKWVYAGTMLSSGLVNRRKAEAAMFNGPLIGASA
jgi:lysozyme